MTWPLSQDYNEAIQNPAQCFADPELRQGQAETNELGLPAPRSGNFADVYAVVTGKRKWAVKCFTRQIPGLQERYQQIGLHLTEHKPSFMVDFSFLEKGIRVRGEWYPILKMEWVEGFTLNQFIKNHLHKPNLLDLLCQLWVKLSARLRKANIAHCDLQHGNVLLVPASRARALAIKLVDYDGMCVPSLTLLKTIELGHPAYQHPQRQREGIYNLEVDRFSNLVIYTAVRGLQNAGKALWEKYDDGDNLLFKPADFVTPTKSRLFYELLKSDNPDLARLARVLIQAATEPLAKAPLLEELAPEALARPTSVTAGAPGGPSPGEKEGNVFASQLQGASVLRRPRGARGKSRTGLLVAAGILLVVIVAGASGYLVYRGDSTGQPPDKQIAQGNNQNESVPMPNPPPRLPDVDKKTNLKETKSELSPRPKNRPLLPSPEIDHKQEGDKASPPLPKPPAPPEPGPPAPAPPAPSPPAGPDASGRAPVPSQEEQASALDKVRQIYKDDLKSRKSKELEDLALRLLRQGQTTMKDRPLQFVFLREARDKAAEAARADLAVQAVDEMAKRFPIQTLEDKAGALEHAREAAVTPDHYKGLVKTAQEVLTGAVKADDYAVAVRLLTVADFSAALSGSRSLQTSVRAKSDEVHGLKKEYEKLRPDLVKLTVDPDDTDANLALGRYCCFGKKDWDRGLPCLAKGSDPELAELAKAELKQSSSPGAWAKLGDGWRQFLARADAGAKAQARKKAYDWYYKAYADVSDAEATRLEKAMSALVKDMPGLRRSTWGEGLDISQAMDKKNFLVLQPGKSLTTRRQYSGPLLISAAVRTSQYSLLIRAYGDGSMEFKGTEGGHQIYLQLPSPNADKRIGHIVNFGLRLPYIPGAKQVVQWRISSLGMDVLVNGKVIYALPREPDLSGHRGAVMISSRDGTMEVYSLHVTPLR